MPLARGDTRAIVDRVIGVGSVEDRGQPAATGQRRHLAVELGLAEEATVRGILPVARVFELVGSNHLVVESDLGGELARLAKLRARTRGAVGGDRQAARAELLVGNVGDEGAIDSTGKRHQDRLFRRDGGAQVTVHLPQRRAEPTFMDYSRHREFHIEVIPNRG